MESAPSTERVCATCDETKPLTSEFWCPQRGYRDGFTPHCRECTNERNKKYKAVQRKVRGAKPKRKPRLVDGVEWWPCATPECGWHPRSEFYLAAQGDWPRPLCKVCHNRVTIEDSKRSEVRQRAKQRRSERHPETARKMAERAERRARGVRLCPGPCGRELPFIEFRPTAQRPTGSRSRCQECRNKQAAQYARDLRQRDPERARAIVRARSAKRRGAEVSDLTHDEWMAIRRAYGDRCAFCGVVCHDRPETTPDKLTYEHEIPITRGGWHSASNVFPACWTCNCSKQDRTAAEFAADTGLVLDIGPHPLLQLRLGIPLPRKDRPRRPFAVPDGWNRLVLACEVCRACNSPLCEVCERRVTRWLAGQKPRKFAPRFDDDGNKLHFCSDPECPDGWQPDSAFYASPRGGLRSKCKGCFARRAAERSRAKA